LGEGGRWGEGGRSNLRATLLNYSARDLPIRTSIFIKCFQFLLFKRSSDENIFCLKRCSDISMDTRWLNQESGQIKGTIMRPIK
jgi:hypothetical protein